MDLLSSFHARSTRETARRTRVRIDGTCLVGAPPSAAECRSLVLFLRGLAAGRKHLLQVLVLEAPDALVLRHSAAGRAPPVSAGGRDGTDAPANERAARTCTTGASGGRYMTRSCRGAGSQPIPISSCPRARCPHTSSAGVPAGCTRSWHRMPSRRDLPAIPCVRNPPMRPPHSTMRSARPRECASARRARSALARRRGSASAPSARGTRTCSTARHQGHRPPALPGATSVPARPAAPPLRTPHDAPAACLLCRRRPWRFPASCSWFRVPGPPLKPHLWTSRNWVSSPRDVQTFKGVHGFRIPIDHAAAVSLSWVLLAIAQCERRCLGGLLSSCLACRSWMVGADGA